MHGKLESLISIDKVLEHISLDIEKKTMRN